MLESNKIPSPIPVYSEKKVLKPIEKCSNCSLNSIYRIDWFSMMDQFGKDPFYLKHTYSCKNLVHAVNSISFVYENFGIVEQIVNFKENSKNLILLNLLNQVLSKNPLNNEIKLRELEKYLLEINSKHQLNLFQ